ncbi:hypothetical protein PspLS_00147 [Pyricularia sp. CBS 133598]|nr:hypothetical protein PspLS_00147 [Pyricularia sp. CBS 133598]
MRFANATTVAIALAFGTGSAIASPPGRYAGSGNAVGQPTGQHNNILTVNTKHGQECFVVLAKGGEFVNNHNGAQWVKGPGEVTMEVGYYKFTIKLDHNCYPSLKSPGRVPHGYQVHVHGEANDKYPFAQYTIYEGKKIERLGNFDATGRSENIDDYIRRADLEEKELIPPLNYA